MNGYKNTERKIERRMINKTLLYYLLFQALACANAPSDQTNNSKSTLIQGSTKNVVYKLQHVSKSFRRARLIDSNLLNKLFLLDVAKTKYYLKGSGNFKGSNVDLFKDKLLVSAFKSRFTKEQEKINNLQGFYIIEDVYYIETSQECILALQLNNPDYPSIALVGLSKNMKVNWCTIFSGLNLCAPLLAGDNIYLGFSSFVGMYDLVTKKIEWSHKLDITDPFTAIYLKNDKVFFKSEGVLDDKETLFVFSKNGKRD